MTEEIYLGIAGLEHMSRQPSGFRYSLSCHEVYSTDCESRRRMGHLGNFASYFEAKKEGLIHPHAVSIRFWRHYEEMEPSSDFLEDLRNLPSARR